MDETLIVRISALEHYSYCPRQCALIEVEGQWEDNRHVIKGHRNHRRADSGVVTRKSGTATLRSIPLWSERHRLIGRADVVEVARNRLTPVEYKSGTRHGTAADVQLCAQAICLEEMFDLPVEIGYLWLGGDRRRVPVTIDDDLRAHTIEMIGLIQAMMTTGKLPGAPADDRCDECQLFNRCLPVPVANPRQIDQMVRDLLVGAD